MSDPLKEGRAMWRCYDMTGGSLQLEESLQYEIAREPAAVCNELPRDWLSPRLVTVSEANDDCRLIRIPPGFISC